MSTFTPLTGLLGGSLIGASAGALLLLNGDIMGLSGIFSSVLLHPYQTSQDHPWKIIFVACFLTVSSLYVALVDSDAIHSTIVPSTLAHFIGGLLVGYGTKLSNGCTSGHGICGLGRRSLRSFAAVMAFMSTAVVTTLAVHSSPLFRSDTPAPIYPLVGYIVTASSLLASLYFMVNEDYQKYLGALIAAILASLGLGLSGMVKYVKVENFLNLSLLWNSSQAYYAYDPTLLFVMGGGVLCSWLAYQFLTDHRPAILPRRLSLDAPLLHHEFRLPSNTLIDWQLMGGAGLFGIGWSLGLLCPGPGFFVLAAGNLPALLVWVPMYVLGAFFAEQTTNLEKDRWAWYSGPSKAPLSPKQPKQQEDSDTDESSHAELSAAEMEAIQAAAGHIAIV